jgi:signal peptidase
MRHFGGIIARSLAGLGLGLLITLAFLHLAGGWRVVAVSSDSMAPAIDRGDLLLVRPVPPADIDNGDVILFTTGERTRIEVVHRVASIVTINLSVPQPDGSMATTTAYRFTTKGDANNLGDPGQVDQRDVLGRVYAVLPGLGGPVLAFSLPTVFAALAVAIGLLWLAYEVAGARRRRHESASGA